ncbi:MAG: VOC family protein [Alphaproteobacteria bacterium]
MTKPIPDGFDAITPELVVSDADGAIAFYKKAFGAEEVMRLSAPDGKRLIHAEVRIGGSIVMLASAMPEFGSKSPDQLGGSPAGVHYYCADVDAVVARAAKAGATVVMAPAEMFWGDRYARIVDPFGHAWGIATHTRDLSPEQIAAGQREFLASMSKPG